MDEPWLPRICGVADTTVRRLFGPMRCRARQVCAGRVTALMNVSTVKRTVRLWIRPTTTAFPGPRSPPPCSSVVSGFARRPRRFPVPGRAHPNSHTLGALRPGAAGVSGATGHSEVSGVGVRPSGRRRVRRRRSPRSAVAHRALSLTEVRTERECLEQAVSTAVFVRSSPDSPDDHGVSRSPVVPTPIPIPWGRFDPVQRGYPGAAASAPRRSRARKRAREAPTRELVERKSPTGPVCLVGLWVDPGSGDGMRGVIRAREGGHRAETALTNWAKTFFLVPAWLVRHEKWRDKALARHPDDLAAAQRAMVETMPPDTGRGAEIALLDATLWQGARVLLARRKWPRRKAATTGPSACATSTIRDGPCGASWPDPSGCRTRILHRHRREVSGGPSIGGLRAASNGGGPDRRAERIPVSTAGMDRPEFRLVEGVYRVMGSQ